MELGGGGCSRAEQIFGHDASGGVFASTAATGNGQLALHVHQAARSLINDFADLAIGYSVTNTDVHSSP